MLKTNKISFKEKIENKTKDFELLESATEMEQNFTYIFTALNIFKETELSDKEKHYYILNTIESRKNNFYYKIYNKVKKEDLDYYDRMEEYIEQEIQKDITKEKVYDYIKPITNPELINFVKYIELTLNFFNKVDMFKSRDYIFEFLSIYMYKNIDKDSKRNQIEWDTIKKHIEKNIIEYKNNFFDKKELSNEFLEAIDREKKEKFLKESSYKTTNIYNLIKNNKIKEFVEEHIFNGGNIPIAYDNIFNTHHFYPESILLELYYDRTGEYDKKRPTYYVYNGDGICVEDNEKIYFSFKLAWKDFLERIEKLKKIAKKRDIA